MTPSARPPSTNGLGRRVPKDWDHVTKYPYRALAATTVPAVERVLKLPSWHWTHDQGHEGSCVGHGVAIERAITNSTQNRLLGTLRLWTRRYDPLDIWNESKLVDGFEDTNPGDDNGTTVNAAYKVARERGVRRIKLAGIVLNEAGDPVIVDTKESLPSLEAGVASTRWATTVDEIRTAIAAGLPVTIGVDWLADFDNPVERTSGSWWIGNEGWRNTRIRGGHCVCLYGASDRRQAFRMKNSWGRSYPLVWLTYEAMEGLLARDGEAALVVDR